MKTKYIYNLLPFNYIIFIRLLILCIGLFVPQAQAQYFQKDMMKRQANKEAKRWTLADWLSQKKKVAFMDLWLAMNSSANIFEADLKGGYSKYDFTTIDSSATVIDEKHSTVVALSFWVTLFGLQAAYENTNHDVRNTEGSAALRLLGTSSQSTSIVARYGVREHRDVVTKENWINPFIEGELTLYLLRFFGLEGRYRHYYGAKYEDDVQQISTELTGHVGTAGAFLEVSVFRAYAEYFREDQIFKSNTSESQKLRDGFQFGLRLFF